MPIFMVTAPDGRKLKITAPEGATESQAIAYAQQQLAPQETYDPTEGMSGYDKFMAGAGKAMTDVYRGVGQLAGFVSDEEVNQAKKRDEALMNTGAGIAGNIVGNMATFAPTAFIPGANTYTGAALIGSGIGALTPVAEGESRMSNAALGGGGGIVGRGLTGAASHVFKPRGTDAGNKMLKEGIRMTTGQRLGPWSKRFEEGLTSMPFVGDAIRNAQFRGIKDFNRVAVNRVLAPLGKKTDKIGRDAIDELDSTISQAYDDVLSNVKADTRTDDIFAQKVQKVFNEIADETDDTYNQFVKILRKDVQDFFDTRGVVNNAKLKRLDTVLGEKVRKFKGSQDSAKNALGEGFEGLQKAFRDLVGRQNPDVAPKLKAANEAYANFLRVARAAGSQGAEDGVFTPAQLSSAVKALDPTKHKKGFAKGTALMQDLSDAGKQSISNKLPDSGTPYRTFATLLTGGAGALDPVTTGTMLGAGMGAYSKLGQRMINPLISSRPQVSRQLGGLLEELYPYTPAIGAFSAGLLNQ